MPETEPVVVPIIAIDRATSVTNQIMGNLQRFGTMTEDQEKRLREARSQSWLLYGTMRSLGQSYDVAHMSLRAYLGIGQQVSILGHSLMSTMTSYSAVMYRLDRLQRDVTDAQREAARAVREYGSGSEEAARAGDAVREAEESLAQARQQTVVWTAGLLLSLPRYAMEMWNIGRSIAVARGITLEYAAAGATESAVTATRTATTTALTAAEQLNAMMQMTGMEATVLATSAETAQMALQTQHIGVLGTLRAALTGVQLAGIPFIGWALAAAGVGAAIGLAAAYAGTRQRQATSYAWIGPPEAQTRVGESREILRTGILIGHAGETIGRGRGDVNIEIGQVVLDPQGRDVRSFIRQLGVMVQAARPEVY